MSLAIVQGKESYTRKRHKARTATVASAPRSTRTLPSPVPVAEPSGSGILPELLRRSVLVLLTGLLVARPLVLGEDPGLQAEQSDAGGLVFPLLWFAAAFLWAAWRLWTRRGDWRGGIVELGLLATVSCVFLSTQFAASYKYPAWLISWEWLALLAALFLPRQLVVDGSEQRRVVAALLATVVAVSAHAVYQGCVELPDLKKHYSDINKLRAETAMQADDPGAVSLWQRIQQGYVFGTFSHPNSLAGYLVLGLPPLAVAALVLRRQRGTPGLAITAIGCFLLALAALVLTSSRGALAGLLLVALVSLALLRRRVLVAHWGVALVTLAALVGALYGLNQLGLFTSALGKNSGTAAERLTYWRATAQLIGDHPWLGVGPGNFGNAYLGYMPPTAGETVKDPHNLFLDVWASAGVFALLGLVTALSGFFYLILRRPAVPGTEAVEPRPTGMEPMRVEFYLAGGLGLLLGFVLRAGSGMMERNELIVEGFAAGLRVAVWFVAYGVLERVPWDGRTRALALTAGVAALLLNLLVSGGIGFPALAAPLWTTIALALNGVDPRPWAAGVWRFGQVSLPQLLGAVLPPPLLGALLVLYVLLVFTPAMSAMSLAHEATRHQTVLLSGRIVGTANQAQYLRSNLLAPLDEAARAEPGNARWRVRLAFWYSRLNDLVPPRLGEESTAKMPVIQAFQAQELDPHGAQGYWAEYLLRRGIAERIMRSWQLPEALTGTNPLGMDLLVGPMPLLQLSRIQNRRIFQEQNGFAAAVLEKWLPNDPNNAPLRCAIAEALADSGQAEAARRQARLALELDRQAPPSPRRLTDRQRETLSAWFPNASAD